MKEQFIKMLRMVLKFKEQMDEELVYLFKREDGGELNFELFQDNRPWISSEK